MRQRGAYFSAYDEFAVCDALGFFRFAFRLAREDGARLLASPRPAEEPLPARARAGESHSRPTPAFQRTDNLIDHRPYVPGDDPRRINWKLYGHGGELFVREGKPEPPPHANVLILIDTQFDPLLYTDEMARNGVDVLCEYALSTARACVESARDVQIAWTSRSGDSADGSTALMRGNSPEELAAVLAWPAALPWSAAVELPAAPPDRGLVVLALPRSSADTSALDRFLTTGRSGAQTPELFFVYAGNAENSATGALASATETCVRLYNQRPGVRARGVCGILPRS